MKHLFPPAAFILLIFFVSCNSKTDNKEQLVAPSVIPATTNPILSSNNDSLPVLSTGVTPALTTGVTLNPKHGQPGHRCDIAEGAPLNAPATNNTIQPNVSPTITPVTTTATSKVIPNLNTATAGLNPKHGEPGHRCDIAVGAPLNSKPTQ